MTKREKIATELLAAMIIASEGKAMNTLVEKSVILADDLIEELNATEVYRGPSIRVD